MIRRVGKPDQKSEGVRLVAYYHRNPLKRWWINLQIKLGKRNPLGVDLEAMKYDSEGA